MKSAMKTPDAEHPISIFANRKRVRVMLGGRAIADTTQALTLFEAALPPVFYVPRADTDMSLLERSDRTTHCPYKGDASYFTIKVDGKTVENAVWSYEHPFPAVSRISGLLAFYPRLVDAIEEVPA